MTNFVAARVVPLTDEEIDDLVTKGKDVPTENPLAYFDVYSDDVYWIRDKDDAMVFNTDSIKSSKWTWFNWVLDELTNGGEIIMIPLHGNDFGDDSNHSSDREDELFEG